MASLLALAAEDPEETGVEVGLIEELTLKVLLTPPAGFVGRPTL
jgi:hypothetical protein